MTGELEYRTMCWSDEDVGDLEDDAQVASPSGEGNDNEITVKPVLSEPVFNGHPLLSKSRKSLPLITVILTSIKRHSINRVAQLLSTMSQSPEFKGNKRGASSFTIIYYHLSTLYRDEFFFRLVPF